MRLPALSLTIATFVVLSLACAAPKDDEEEEEETLFGDADVDADTDADSDADADTDTDTDPGGPFALGGEDDDGNTVAGVGGDCAGGSCVYRVTTTRAAGTVEVWIAETADTSDFPWSEEHDGFTEESRNDDGSVTYRLDLDWVADYTEQVNGETTLLNEDTMGSGWAARLTWLFFAVSPDGSKADCLVLGQDASYYASECTETGR